MTVFWIVAVILVMAALLFVLPPLLRQSNDESQPGRRAALNVSIYQDQLLETQRDLDNDVLSQDQYQQSRSEIEKRVLEDVGDDFDAEAVARTSNAAKISAIAIGVLLPILSLSLYGLLGTPEGLAPDEYKPPAVSQQEQSDQINQMVSSLAARLEDDPNNAEGWKMLGRSYLVLERYADARKAFERAVKLLPDDAQVLVDLADTIAMTSDQSLAGRPMELIEHALQIEPQNEKALWLAGTAAYDSQDYRKALEYWQRLYAMQQPGTEGAKTMERNIAEVQALLGEPVTKPAMPATSTSTKAVTAGKVKGELRLATALQDRVSPQDSVFIFAQAPTGPRMPLAVLRSTAAKLPLRFTLDDSLAMMPEMSLSHYPQVVITARVSKSGNASPQSGDLQGQSGIVSSDNSEGIQVVIDQVVP